MTADEQVQLRNADEDARRVAQTCFDRPLVLEAGAGTGKTATLVARIVAWSIGPGWERVAASTVPEDRIASEVLKRVAAITFTEAAAAEMAERVGRALCDLEANALPIGLSEAALPASVGLRRERSRALISALDHLVVSTIHAWCRRILMRHPLAAGFHPGFEVDADESVQQRVVREVIEATLRDTYADPESAPLLELAVAGVGPVQVEDALTTLIREGVEPDDLSENPV